MKHEQIILVILGYVIGFVTAFIAFELSNIDTSYKHYKYTGAEEEYGLVPHMQNGNKQSTNVVPQADAAEEVDTDDAQDAEPVASGEDMYIEEAVLTEEGLFARIGGRDRIVSVKVEGAVDDAAGFHVEVVEALVSPDQTRMYYCVLADPVADECAGYIYVSTTDTVYPVKESTAAAPLRAEIDLLEVAWTEDSRLSLNGHLSIAVDTPWVVE